MADETTILRAQIEDMRVIICEMDGALCNYLNACCDPFEPVSEWDDESHANFKSLRDAYNLWHEKHDEVGAISQQFWAKLEAELYETKRKLLAAERKLEML